jgi:hypothetical protein
MFSASNSFVSLFGNTPFKVCLNTTLILVCLYVVYRWLLRPAITIVSGIVSFLRPHDTEMSFLEITPPAHSEKSPQATQQLFSVIERVIGSSGTISAEIDATRHNGIRYLMRAHPSDIPVLERHFSAHEHGFRFRVLESPPVAELVGNSSYWRIHEIKQSRHYAFPLHGYETYDQLDPVRHIVGSMAKLEPGEMVDMQLVLSPYTSRAATRIYNKILGSGYAMLDNRVQQFIMSRWWVWALSIFYGAITNNVQAGLGLAVVGVVVSFFMPKEKRELTQAEQEVFNGALRKLGQPLFRADIRVLVVAEREERRIELSRGIESSLAPLCVPGFQELYTPNLYPDSLGQKIGLYKFTHRLPSLLATSSNVFAASELADIYHFPYGDMYAEDVIRSHSKTLSAPRDTKRHSDGDDFDVILGRNIHHGSITSIGLTAEERERHVYIIGGTGNGKTTMLEYGIVQDIRNGKGVAIIDPHGTSAKKLLAYIPEERIKDVIYFNPRDLDYPIGLNLLELPEGLSENELAREKELTTEAVLSVLSRIFDDDSDTNAYRIERILRKAIHTAFTIENATLFTALRLLTDTAYRKKIVRTLKDESLKRFWREELGAAGEMQRVKLSSGAISRIDRFEDSETAKRILGQAKSTINFDDIMDNHKILICDFSKGGLGEGTSRLFGTAVLAKLQLAALRREDIPEDKRVPFYLYVDEFQNFASDSFMGLFSEARKYKLFVTMAQQSVAQLKEQNMLNIILDNVGTIVAFRSKSPVTEKLLLHQFSPYIEPGEIANLPRYNFYIKVAATEPQEVSSGETILLEEDGSKNTAKAVIKSSREKYGAAYEKEETATGNGRKSKKTSTNNSEMPEAGKPAP